MPEPMMNPAIPYKWLPLATEAEVPEGKATLVKHERREILIFHRPEGWTAFDNTCPHAGAPIFAEHFDGDCVTCVYHGLRFRADNGVCPEASGWQLEQFPVKVEAGQVLVGFPDF
jgi:nitrite reductase/ring-hydroxylating ferredoxin subunit